jgi:hypothetical protein
MSNCNFYFRNKQNEKENQQVWHHHYIHAASLIHLDWLASLALLV